MKRSEAREQAFIILFEYSFSGDTVAEIVENATDGLIVPIEGFSYKLAQICMENLEKVDDVINRLSTKWKLNRLPKTTLAILRLSIAEITYMDDVPVSVSANEAVEIAKKYSTEDDASYINGVLGAYIKELEILKLE